MILPIIPYGNPILKKTGEDISSDYPSLKELIGNMMETLSSSNGLGIAAHQLGYPIKLFIIDLTSYGESNPEFKNFKKVFINAEILEESGEDFSYGEGCLSIPGVYEEVKRKQKIKIKYLDENFKQQEDEFDKFVARVIQHEYDHTQGILITDRISQFRKQLIKSKLNLIAKGEIVTKYKMKYK